MPFECVADPPTYAGANAIYTVRVSEDGVEVASFQTTKDVRLGPAQILTELTDEAAAKVAEIETVRVKQAEVKAAFGKPVVLRSRERLFTSVKEG